MIMIVMMILMAMMIKMMAMILIMTIMINDDNDYDYDSNYNDDNADDVMMMTTIMITTMIMKTSVGTNMDPHLPRCWSHVTSWVCVTSSPNLNWDFRLSSCGRRRTWAGSWSRRKGSERSGIPSRIPSTRSSPELPEKMETNTGENN